MKSGVLPAVILLAVGALLAMYINSLHRELAQLKQKPAEAETDTVLLDRLIPLAVEAEPMAEGAISGSETFDFSRPRPAEKPPPTMDVWIDTTIQKKWGKIDLRGEPGRLIMRHEFSGGEKQEAGLFPFTGLFAGGGYLLDSRRPIFLVGVGRGSNRWWYWAGYMTDFEKRNGVMVGLGVRF